MVRIGRLYDPRRREREDGVWERTRLPEIFIEWRHPREVIYARGSGWRRELEVLHGAHGYDRKGHKHSEDRGEVERRRIPIVIAIGPTAAEPIGWSAKLPK
jgi:hypothetical protein